MRWEASNALAAYHDLLHRAQWLEKQELAMEKEYGR